MAVLIALLRAVNVGGTGKLPMSDLKRLCAEVGFQNVRTYIASGNVVFETDLSAAKARVALETALHAYAGKPVGVVIRTPAELAELLRSNPFPDAAPNRAVVTFFEEPLPRDCLDSVKGHGDEALHLGEREIWVHYGQGMASSKLVIPVARNGTGRNLNTVAKLVEIAVTG